MKALSLFFWKFQPQLVINPALNSCAYPVTIIALLTKACLGLSERIFSLWFTIGQLLKGLVAPLSDCLSAKLSGIRQKPSSGDWEPRTIVKSCSGSLEPSCISSPSLNSETFHPSPSLTLIPPGNHHDLIWLIVLRSLLVVSSPWMSRQELWNYCPDFETCSLNVIFKYAEIKCTADKSSRTFQIKCIKIAYLSCGILSAFGISQSIKQYRMVYWKQSNTEIQHSFSACWTHDQYAATIH